MTYIRLLPVLLVGVLFGNAVTVNASKYDVWEESYNVSGLLGAIKYDNLKFDLEDSSSSKADLSLIPQVGGAWMTLPKGDWLQVGLETSFLLGFQVDKITYASIGGDGLYVSVSASMWMFDLAGGAYANLYLDPGRRVRLYAGGGPLMVYASYHTESEFDDGSDEVDTTESAFGVGVYARTGIEFRIHQRGMLGIGARGTWNSVDFSDVGGQSEMSGVAGFVSYTAGF